MLHTMLVSCCVCRQSASIFDYRSLYQFNVGVIADIEDSFIQSLSVLLALLLAPGAAHLCC
jgi:hypothetical protein